MHPALFKKPLKSAAKMIVRTMSIIHSHNNTLDSIFVNNTGNTVQSCEWL